MESHSQVVKYRQNGSESGWVTTQQMEFILPGQEIPTLKVGGCKIVVQWYAPIYVSICQPGYETQQWTIFLQYDWHHI